MSQRRWYLSSPGTETVYFRKIRSQKAFSGVRPRRSCGRTRKIRTRFRRIRWWTNSWNYTSKRIKRLRISLKRGSQRSSPTVWPPWWMETNIREGSPPRALRSHRRHLGVTGACRSPINGGHEAPFKNPRVMVRFISRGGVASHIDQQPVSGVVYQNFGAGVPHSRSRPRDRFVCDLKPFFVPKSGLAERVGGKNV